MKNEFYTLLMVSGCKKTLKGFSNTDNHAFIPLTVQVKFEGSVDDVKIACAAARDAALMFNKPGDVLAEIIEGPYDGTNSLSVITKVPFK